MLPKDQVTLWIRPLDVQLVNDSITLEASNDIILNKIRTNFLTYIKAVLKEMTGKDVSVELKLKQINSEPQTTYSVKKKSTRVKINDHLDSRFTFSNFIEGRSNTIALAASLQTATASRVEENNPLLIYGLL